MNGISQRNLAPDLALPGGPHWGMSTMVEVARWRAERQGDERAYEFLLDGEARSATLTYAELDRRARTIAAELQRRGARGERVLLVLEPGLDYVAALFGCFYAGAVAVPVYPPDPFRIARTMPRLQAIFRGAECGFLLSTDELLGGPSSALRRTCPRGAIDIRTVPPDALDDWRPAEARGDHLALLQYTSGTTGEPRGVAITFDNLQYNLRCMEQLLDVPDAVAMHWLPPYHDLGLVGGVFLPLFAGRRVVLMSPLHFMQRPARWLEAISRHGATSSAAPNFGYELCLRKISEAECEGLDLSRWQVAVSGAEQVRSETLDRFCERFAPFGFRREAFVPAYGMAETTLMVSISRLHVPPVERDYAAGALADSRVAPRNGKPESMRRLIGCGPPGPEIDLRIVSPATREVVDGVGEVWVRGPGVASGYWRSPEATAEAFAAELANGEGGFLRTGDLGFVDQGELFIVGRRKETLILGGRNYFPQDIELAIQAQHPAFKADGGAVTAVEADSQERVVVFQEVQRPKRHDLDELVRLIRTMVAEETLQEPYAVVLLPVGELPKTSSGKTRRAECWREFQQGALSVVAAWCEGDANRAQDFGQRDDEPPLGPTEIWLAECWRSVLGEEHVSRGDSFFRLGGRSLQVVEMLQAIAEKTGHTLSMKALFERPTLTELAALIDELPATACGAAQPKRAPAAFKARPQSLSEPQKRFWLLEQLGLRGGANVPLGLRLAGPADSERVERALNEVVQRHQMLRTAFDFHGLEPTQRLIDSARVSVERLAPPPHSDAAGDPVAWALDHEFAWRPFDLASPPLMRAAVIPWSDEEYVLLLVVHHLVADGGAFDALLAEITSLCAGRTPDAPEFDYWDFLTSPPVQRDADAEHAYWRERLGGLPAAISLPLESGDPARTPREVSVAHKGLPESVCEAVRRLAEQQGVTPLMVYLSAFHLLLGRYSGDEHVGVGVPLAGRDHAAWRRTIGCFLDAAPVAADVSRDESYDRFLARLRDDLLADFEHARLPWDDVLEASGAERVAGRMPLVQTFFLYEDTTPGVTEIDGRTILDAATDYRGLGVYDLTLVVGAREARLVFDPARLDPGLVERMLDAYTRVLEAVSRDPSQQVASLAIQADDQCASMVRLATGPSAPNTGDTPLTLFESQARRTPDAVAVVCGRDTRTYEQLAQLASRFAQALAWRGVRPGDRVALSTRRSADMLAAMLGVWKAGAAYVPIDPAYPAARRERMIDDCDPVLTLVDDRGGDGLRTVGLTTLLAEQSGHDTPLPPPDGDRLAYLIYTSGSTGKPKGVMVHHGAVTNFVGSFARDLGVLSADRVLAATTVSFDISVLELFLPLTVGAVVVLADSDTVGDGPRLARLIDDAAPTLIQGTPSTFRMLHAAGWRATRSQRVVAGGEELTPDVARTLHASAGALWNVYGPTETTIWSTLQKVASVDGPIPIGRPIDNTTCFVLDKRGRLAPEGVWGELTIGGAGVAKGYWRQAELTAERFPPDPFAGRPDARMYRTGDSARWVGGVLEFGGRSDDQVKVRGHRIELREIELALCECPELAEAAVATRGGPTGASLVAYVVASPGASADPARLRRRLGERLPAYMIPSTFVAVPDGLPRSGAGKIDRKRLAEVAGGRAVRSAERVAPRGPLEERLAAWWREVLRVDDIGVYDSVFELGGHSLSVMQLVVRVRDALGVDLALREVYARPTIADWAEMILAGQLKDDEPVADSALLAELATMTDEQAIEYLDSMSPE